MNAPYTGGFAPGNRQFAVDGNFYNCDPCSPPKITFPMKGDSIFSNADIIYLSEDGAGGYSYTNFSLGNWPNIQPWSANQRTFVIEQEFMVAMEAYQSLPLNTPYWWGWSIGWQSQLTNGLGIPELFYAVFVEEDPTEDMGQGIVKVRRRFATLPPTRNEIEQFTYIYPGITYGVGIPSRLQRSITVSSRVQYDYFIFDDFGIYPYGSEFPAGPVLRARQGIYPPGLILQPMYFYKAGADSVLNNIFLDSDQIQLSDGSVLLGTPATTPSASQWLSWIDGTGTSNGQRAEVIAEASVPRRWMGNIWERRTRFVQVV
jgi:hypothetical protein